MLTVYKAIVGRSGDYPIKLKADLRPKKKETIDAFITYDLAPDCTCPILTNKGWHIGKLNQFCFTIPTICVPNNNMAFV